jgi:hypothetical protein
MLDRKETLFLQSWGSVKSGGRPAKSLAEVQEEYLRRVQLDARKMDLVKQQRKEKKV